MIYFERKKYTYAIIGSILLILITYSPSHAQKFQENLWMMNGEVRSIAIDKNHENLFVGGTFLYSGPLTGHGAIIDVSTGFLEEDFPYVNGAITSAVPDGNGGWYISGGFNEVGGLPRGSVAHIGPDNSVTPWNPDISNTAGSREVLTINFDGNYVYIGGSFNQVGDSLRNRLAAIDPLSGLATDWNPDSNGRINAIKIVDSTLYTAGNFTEIGGHTRNLLAAFDISTGQLSGWDPDVQGIGVIGREVRNLAVTSDHVMISGSFNQVGDSTRVGFAAISRSSGGAILWEPEFLPNVTFIRSLKVLDDNLFVSAGSSTYHYNANSLELTNIYNLSDYTEPLGWIGDVYQIDNRMVIGGFFGGSQFIDYETPRNFISIDTVTGEPDDLECNVQLPLRVLSYYNGRLLMGGEGFSHCGKVVSNFISLDALKGASNELRTRIDNDVRALAVAGDTLYLGGYLISKVGDSTRTSLASVQISSGEVTNWNPVITGGIINQIFVIGNSLLVRGAFTEINGQQRNRIAEFDLETGELTDWNPQFSASVDALHYSDNTLYAGGRFTEVDDQPRSRIAAFDFTTKDLLEWTPNFDNRVLAITSSDSVVYVYGIFNQVNDLSRNGLAAVNKQTGGLTPWDPVTNGHVNVLKYARNTVYTGGEFSLINGENIRDLAALDAQTGEILDWNPRPSGRVNELVVSEKNNKIYVGGYFSFIGMELFNNTAVNIPAEDYPVVFSLAQNYPNPFNPTTTLHYQIPEASKVRLDVYDILGRHVTSLVNEQLAAGEHTAMFDGSRLASGVYIYKLQAAGNVSVRKMMLVK